MKKKILGAILLSIIALHTGVATFAEEEKGVDVCYEYERASTYTLNVPERVDLSDETNTLMDVSVDYDLDVNKQGEVTLKSDDMKYLFLYLMNIEDPEDKVFTSMRNSLDEPIQNESTILNFASDEAPAEGTAKETISFAKVQGATKAAKYQTQLVFVASLK